MPQTTRTLRALALDALDDCVHLEIARRFANATNEAATGWESAVARMAAEMRDMQHVYFGIRRWIELNIEDK